MLRSTSLSRHVAGTTLFRNSFLPQHFPKTTTATACPHLKMVAYSQLPPRPSHSLVSSCDRPMRFSGSVLRGQGGQMSPLVVRARMNRSSSLLTASPLRPSILFPLSLSSSFPVGSVSYFSSQYPGGGGRGPPSGWVRGAGMLGASAVVLFGKGKYVLGALKLTKLASLGSMVLTIGTYSIFFGAPYAIGMVGLITVHEVGHALVMMHRGIPFSPMVFIPFMGAMIAMNQRPRDAWEDALVAFGGPVLGSLGAGGVVVAAHMTDSQLLFALADFGFMINLFNLMPLGSMDGGRIAGALSKWSHVAGLGMGGTLAYTGAVSNPIFYLVLLAGGWETFQRFYNPGSMPLNYYKITTAQRAAIGLGYAGLVGGLCLAMDTNHRYQKAPEVLMRERELERSWDMR